MTKPTILFVTDIETTLKKRMAFDIAWKAIDKKGRVYGKGSYIVKEAFNFDIPFFRDKLGHYFSEAFEQLIRPASIHEIREEYNGQVKALKQAGHRIVLSAYNAAFDFRYLPLTLRTLTNSTTAKWMDSKVELLDIWDFWGESVPKKYKANPTDSGKYVSTTAESAYRWEFNNPEFTEKHIAWHDVEIETEILLKAISRKKPMPIVDSPEKFTGAVWKKINTRLGIDGSIPLEVAA